MRRQSAQQYCIPRSLAGIPCQALAAAFSALCGTRHSAGRDVQREGYQACSRQTPACPLGPASPPAPPPKPVCTCQWPAIPRAAAHPTGKMFLPAAQPWAVPHCCYERSIWPCYSNKSNKRTEGKRCGCRMKLSATQVGRGLQAALSQLAGWGRAGQARWMSE